MISLQSKGLSRVFSPPQSESINSSLDAQLGLLYGLTLTSLHDYWKTIALTRWTFVGKVMSLLFNVLSSLVIAFLSRRKHLLISWLQSLSIVILEPKKIESVTVSIFFPILPWGCPSNLPSALSSAHSSEVTSDR